MTEAVKRSQGDSGVAVGWVGSLAHTPLPEVIRRIVIEERSGDLQITSPSAIKTIYFDRGFVVFASSDLKSDRLGESLIEAGRISRREFFLASMMMQPGKRKFGQALVEAGIVSEEELGCLVAAQVNRIVLSLFSVKLGMYSFDERPCIIPLELMVSLSVYRIFTEGIRRMTSKKLILTGLPPLDTQVKIVDAPPFTVDIDKLRPTERAVIRSIGKGASFHKITKTIGGDEGKVLRACYSLYAAGVVEGCTPDVRRRPRRVQEETGTFVLSEIRRKVGKRRDEAIQSSTPAEPEGSGQAPENGPPFPFPGQAATPPELDAMPGQAPRIEKTSSPTPEAAELDELPASTSSGSQISPNIMSSFKLAVVEPIFKFFRRLLGHITESPEVQQEPFLAQEEQPPASRQDPGQPAPPSVESLDPHDPPHQEATFILEKWPEEEREQTEPDRASSKPEGRDSKGENLTTESVGVPSWSLRDDRKEALEPSTDSLEKAGQRKQRIESVGVPSWSLKDDPHGGLKQSLDLDEDVGSELPQQDPVSEIVGTPEWSIKDGPSDLKKQPLSYEERESESRELEPLIELEPDEEELPGPLLPSTAGSRPPALEIESTDRMLASLDNDLFVEQELEEDQEPSMLSHIALEEIKLEEKSAELDIEIEKKMFADLPDRIKEQLLISENEPEDRDDQTEGCPEAVEVAASAPLSAPAPMSSLDDESLPDASAPPPQDGDSEEKKTSSKAEDPMEAVRLKQRGGEARLFRDVKLHFNFRDYEGAIPLLEQLVKISPGTALYRGMLARAMSRNPPTSNRAEKHFIEALRLSPQDPELHYWLGLYYKKFGLKARASKEFRTTLRIDSNHEGARKQLVGAGKRGVALGGVLKKLFG